MTSNKKLENNCDTFLKFLKTLKTNVGFHFTRLVSRNVMFIYPESSVDSSFGISISRIMANSWKPPVVITRRNK